MLALISPHYEENIKYKTLFFLFIFKLAIINFFYLNKTLESETSSIFDERSFIRVSTAPPRPLTDLEEFKRSTEFLLLE